MNKTTTASRIFLAVIFIVFGLNKFLHFAATPPITAEAGALLGAFAKTGYFFPMIAIFQILSGLLLLTKRFALLGALILSPVLFNILAINTFLNPQGFLFPAILFTALILVLIGHKKQLKALAQA